MSTPITLTISGMHCGVGVRRVSAGLCGVDGATDVKVDVGNASFVVDDEDDDTDGIVDEAKAAVAALGFTVDDVKVGAP